MSKNRKRASRKNSKDDDDDHYYIPDKKDGRKLVEVKDQKVLDKYMNLSKPDLQHYLRWNGQLVTGSKLELLLRCLDGEINGRIPKCDSCGQGQFVYDYTESKYICRGYFDHLAKTPIRCGNTADNVGREDRWRDPNRGDSPYDKFAKENSSSSKKKGSKEDHETSHHSEHPEHHHHSHHCQVEANHPFVDLLEDMAYYHAVLKDEKWNYRARAFLQSARAVENLDFEVDLDNVDELGKKGGKEHVERIGPSSAEAMKDFLQNDKKSCSQLDGMRKAIKEKKDKGEISKEDEDKVGTSSSYAGPGQKLKRKSSKKSKASAEE